MAVKTVQVPDMVTVGELAQTLDIPVTKLVGELFKNGIVATINQQIDTETAQIIVDELGLDVQLEAEEVGPIVKESQHELSEFAVERPPIVAVMGHVDHGKTTLLDAILDTKVQEGEAGGITQHISAYQTMRNGRSITLLDTPGHEAFAALRQHGAILTDVVIIVIAADDGVKPQTVEAIKFAQSANAKIVVAITKSDKDTANIDRVKAQLASEYNMNPEEWGGDTLMVDVSAKTGHNLDKLLDLVLLVADIEELKADVDVPAEGLVIESHMETGRGPVVSMLVDHGELKPGQFVVSGTTYAKVRTLIDYAGRPIKLAGPATPATVTGFKEIPSFGDRFVVAKNEKTARNLVEKHRLNQQHEAVHSRVTGADLLRMMNKSDETQDINVVVRADVQGSLTSVTDSLKLMENEELNMRIISTGVGNITENDVRLAQSADAIIYGFNVKLPPTVKRMAMRVKVSVRIFNVIYELLDDVKEVMESKLAPEVVESVVGTLRIMAIFRTTRDSVICGGEVLSGKITPSALARVVRDKTEVIAEVEVKHVQRQQQEAKEVFEGEQCGLELKTKSKIQLVEGDRLELFTRELKTRHL
ncbi:translation initiation factor IF-2 [Candidatus Saccharibacteria bacterium]|nr:translation initiation factor IF-2 [Candidatus Saccharibacteria bacterium]NCU40603.1 translation initiation factor IF-2 [Candidatus Saccharibacteria bacterium]